MTEQTLVDIRNVTMCFDLAQEQFSGLKDFIIMATRGKLKFHKFQALHDVTFKIHQGEAWALIGENGCGKSTLLKIISGIYRPTSGSVRVNGSIAPLIELGAGFDMELTARENVFLNGAVLGYSKQMMENHMQEIIDFSELIDFMDVPIKNFSSGMIARLGFSIATVVRADIIIIDEILAVGDEAFQKKCHQRMAEMMALGTTVIFVSHSDKDVRKICKNAVWLRKGQVQAIGPVDKVCDKYQAYLRRVH